MKRLLLNSLAGLALAFGAVTLSTPSFASTAIDGGPTCGDCECDPGQNCTSGQDGCTCWYPVAQ